MNIWETFKLIIVKFAVPTVVYLAAGIVGISVVGGIVFVCWGFYMTYGVLVGSFATAVIVSIMILLATFASLIQYSKD